VINRFPSQREHLKQLRSEKKRKLRIKGLKKERGSNPGNAFVDEVGEEKNTVEPA